MSISITQKKSQVVNINQKALLLPWRSLPEEEEIRTKHLSATLQVNAVRITACNDNSIESARAFYEAGGWGRVIDNLEKVAVIIDELGLHRFSESLVAKIDKELSRFGLKVYEIHIRR